MSKTPIGILISGRGSNMQALVRAAQGPDFPAEVRVVIANSEDAGGLEWAKAQGIEALAIPHKPYGKDRAAHEAAIDAALRERGVQVIALAGYMRVLTPFLVKAWEGKMLNIHPSLLPKFPGLHTHEQAIEAGELEAGCTIHLVSEGVDEGPILGQARVPVYVDDTPDTLAQRVLVEEHKLYPAVLAEFLKGL